MNMQSENQPHVSCISTSPPVKLCLAGAFSMQGFGQLLSCEAVAMWLSPTFSNDPLETFKKKSGKCWPTSSMQFFLLYHLI